MEETTSADKKGKQIELSEREKHCLFAFIIMLILFLPYALLEPISSDTNDDTAMNLIAAGAFGENSQYLVYINILFGYLLKWLFAMIPSINWYVGIQLLLNAFSAALLGAALAYFLDYRHLIIPLVLLHFLIAGEFYQSVQFTRNGYLYALCGIVMLTMSCFVSSHRIAVSVTGSAMLFAAFLIRSECVYPMLPFLMLLLFRQFIISHCKCLLPVIAVILTILACASAYLANKKLFREREEWGDYYYYHFSGTFPILDNDINRWFSFDSDDLSLGLNDLILLNEYHYSDFVYFSVERLKDFQTAKTSPGVKEVLSSASEILLQNNLFPEIPDYVNIDQGIHSVLYGIERFLRWNVCLDLIIFLYLIYLLKEKRVSVKELIWILLLFACMLTDFLAIIYFAGHTPRRATIGPRMAFELLSAFVLLSGAKPAKEKTKATGAPAIVTALTAALLFITGLRFMNHSYMPADTETSLVLKELQNYDNDYYLLDSMLLWGERLGITDIRTLTRDNYYDYFDHFILSGGWLAETPLATHYTYERGVDAPMTQLALDPHYHYVVRSWKAEYLVPYLNDYLMRRTGLNLIPTVSYAGNDLYIIDFNPLMPDNASISP